MEKSGICARILTILLILAPAVLAQNGTIQGIVLDPTGASVAGAAVRIEDAAVGARLARRLAVTVPGGKPVTLRLGVNLDLGGDPLVDGVGHGGPHSGAEVCRARACSAPPMRPCSAA